MSNAAKLTPFSYVILVLVGEGGAGPHDLVRMMRDGRVYWAAPESQYYAEPKRLAQAGYLEAAKQPGRTHAKTQYTLTDQGRTALAEWLATPARFARIQNEAVVRLLASEYADRGVLLQSLTFLERELDELTQALSVAAQREAELPRRSRALAINRRLALRILDAHRAWITEVRELA
ncbi:helix-turn-helix transcriptional regulator [Solirubrobacter taibaiensis]|nr:helix-turn-helix transcriptional regulator [Solirubrobacter taibaiensis]